MFIAFIIPMAPSADRGGEKGSTRGEAALGAAACREGVDGAYTEGSRNSPLLLLPASCSPRLMGVKGGDEEDEKADVSSAGVIDCSSPVIAALEEDEPGDRGDGEQAESQETTERRRERRAEEGC
jgi:hypothetical protein